MIAIVWEFVVKPEALAAFQRAYGPTGDWAALFRESPGFAGTTLLRDGATGTRFLTIDRWTEGAHYEEMRRSRREEYARLDEACAELTISERALGIFTED